MSCIQQNFPSKFKPNDASYEKLEKNTFVAFILRHPVGPNFGIGRHFGDVVDKMGVIRN